MDRSQRYTRGHAILTKPLEGVVDVDIPILAHGCRRRVIRYESPDAGCACRQKQEEVPVTSMSDCFHQIKLDVQVSAPPLLKGYFSIMVYIHLVKELVQLRIAYGQAGSAEC